MKNLLMFTAFIFCISCNNSNVETNNYEDVSPVSEAIDNMDWLLGSWERMDEAEGKITHEHWKRISDKEYKGLGCTMVEKDTVWQENMSLIHNDSIWIFKVKGTNAEQATIFNFTDLTKNSFTCENEENEFPKKIEYYKDKEYLKAKISGGGPEIPFQFKKM